MLEVPKEITDLAIRVSKRGNCLRKQVGAVFYCHDTGLLLATGCNKAKEPCTWCSVFEQPSPSPCTEAKHAEISALESMPSFIPEKVSVFTTLSPCLECADRVTRTFGGKLQQWAYSEIYRNQDGLALLDTMGIAHGVGGTHGY